MKNETNVRNETNITLKWLIDSLESRQNIVIRLARKEIKLMLVNVDTYKIKIIKKIRE